jgi:hypothetical protein
MGSTAEWPTLGFGFLYIFKAFGRDSILNKQKIIKKIAFLVKMPKIVSFRANHKISAALWQGQEQKKVYRNSKKRSNLTKIISRGVISKKVPFQTTLRSRVDRKVRFHENRKRLLPEIASYHL